MKKWMAEDWQFELTVTEGKAEHCRLGIEKGDRFIFSYECPCGCIRFHLKAVPINREGEEQ